MARLVGKKGLDTGAVVDVPEDAAEDLVSSGDYAYADQEISEEQETFGEVSNWDAHQDYSVHGVRERGEAAQEESAPPARETKGKKE